MRQAIEASGKCEMGMLGAGMGMGMETKVVGDGWGWRHMYAGTVGMDTELAGTDEDGDECTSPCTTAGSHPTRRHYQHDVL